MKPAIEAKVKAHGEKLNKIFNTGIEPMKLCRALRRIENEAHKLAEDACNWLSMESDEFVGREEKILDKLVRLNIVLPAFRNQYGNKKSPVFINFGPRGYALKIDDEYVRDHKLEIPTDWGGYGIIAPDLS